MSILLFSFAPINSNILFPNFVNLLLISTLRARSLLRLRHSKFKEFRKTKIKRLT